jgi:hypothetical protein
MLRTEPDGGWKLLAVMEEHSRSPLRDARFILHGLDPNTADEIPAFFLEPERKLGATARFSGRSVANGPVTVRLEPCGTAKLRLVTSQGKPLDRYTALRSLDPGTAASGLAAGYGDCRYTKIPLSPSRCTENDSYRSESSKTVSAWPDSNTSVNEIGASMVKPKTGTPITS